MLDIETSTTPVEAPFSNGIAEKNNKILYEPMMKTMEDSKCAMYTACHGQYQLRMSCRI